MRAYFPIGWATARTLSDDGEIAGPLRGCAVDPEWRAGAADVEEEEGEYEAAELAAGSLDPVESGVILALDLPDDTAIEQDDGWFDWAGPLLRRELGAVLGSDLGWHGVQELTVLLDEREGAANPAPSQPLD